MLEGLVTVATQNTRRYIPSAKTKTAWAPLIKVVTHTHMHLLITLVMGPKYLGSDGLVFSGAGIKSKIAPVPPHDGIVPSLSNVSPFLIRHVKMMMTVKLAYLFTIEFPLSIRLLRLIFSQIIFLKWTYNKNRNIDERKKRGCARATLFLSTKPLNRLCVAIRTSGGRAKASDPSFHSFPSSLSIRHEENKLEILYTLIILKCVCVAN